MERIVEQPIARCDRAQVTSLRLLETSEPIPSLEAVLEFIAYDLRALPGLAPTFARRAFNLPLLAWTVKDTSDLAIAHQQADNTIFETLPTLPPPNSSFSRVRDRSMEMCQTC